MRDKLFRCALSATGGSPSRPNPNERLYIRIEEQFVSTRQFGGPNTPPHQIKLGRIDTVNGSLPNFLGNQTVPAGSTMPFVAGRNVLQIPSGAANLTRIDNTLDNAAMPLSQLFQDVNAPPLNRPLRVYTFLVPVRITVAGTARIEIAFCTGSGLLTFAGTPPAAAWSSDPATNAGRWLPRYRQVNAGAIVNGADSGVTASGWHILGLRYVENATPRIEWLLDGIVRHTVSADANMPTFPGGVNPPGWVPAYGVSTPAGTTVQFGEGSFEVSDI